MSIQTEIDRIITAVSAAHQKVAAKGGTTAQPYLVGNLADAIDTIPTGAQLPALTNPGKASDALSGKEFIDGSGNKVTGTIATQGAQTITPGTADKTIASGKYLTGTQTIKGDANLVAGNIKSGVSIFGVTGTLEAGSGGGSGGGSVETCTVEIASANQPRIFATIQNSDGSIGYTDMKVAQSNTKSVIENVLCGSYILIYSNDMMVYGQTGCELLYSYNAHRVFNVTISAGGVASIRLGDI